MFFLSRPASAAGETYCKSFSVTLIASICAEVNTLICADVINVAFSDVKPERSVVIAANVLGASAATASAVNLPT